MGSYQCTCKEGYKSSMGNEEKCQGNKKCTIARSMIYRSPWKIECLIIIIDIDECMFSPCHANATCTNTLGAYTCECDPGYVGDGFICQLQLEGNIISVYMH